MGVKTLEDLLAEGVSGRGVLVRSDHRHPKRALAITQMILLYRLLHGPR